MNFHSWYDLTEETFSEDFMIDFIFLMVAMYWNIVCIFKLTIAFVIVASLIILYAFKVRKWSNTKHWERSTLPGEAHYPALTLSYPGGAILSGFLVIFCRVLVGNDQYYRTCGKVRGWSHSPWSRPRSLYFSYPVICSIHGLSWPDHEVGTTRS